MTKSLPVLQIASAKVVVPDLRELDAKTIHITSGLLSRVLRALSSALVDSIIRLLLDHDLLLEGRREEAMVKT